MQEEENKSGIPMVDIDTSGPGADVELEEQKPEGEVETKEEDSSSAPQVGRLEKRKQRAATRSQRLKKKISLKKRKKN